MQLIMNDKETVRRNRAYISAFTIIQLHLKNPWMSAWWSFSYPGCGHLFQGRTMKGLLLITWEIVINTNAKINLAILYSMLGKFDLAKAVIHTRWFIVYVALYVFAIWDSYRGTVDTNKHYILADREDAPLKPLHMSSFDINYLDKRNPWVAMAWSMLTPGLGYFYVHKVISGVFMVVWTIMVMYFSHCLQAVQFSMVGDFEHAKTVVDMQWLMYIPSIYTFVAYDCYVCAVEYNKLFEKAQSRYLRDHYQNARFALPI
jgi:hypothetical protein